MYTSRQKAGIAAVVLVLAAAVALVLSLLGSGSASEAGRASSGAPASGAPASSAPASSIPTRGIPSSHPRVAPSVGPGAPSSSPAGSSSHTAPRRSTGAVPPVARAGTHHADPPPSAPERVPHVGVQLRGPGAFHGFCPATLDYTATITVDSTPALIKYRWSNGTTIGDVSTVTATHSPLTLALSVATSDSTLGEVYLEVLSPVALTSNVLNLDVSCVGVSVGTASTNPPAYTGDCSRGIDFTTTVAVTVTNGPILLHYEWVNSDGAGPAPQTAYFGPGTSTQTLSYTWRRTSSSGTGAPETAAAQLWVLDGPRPVSNISSFSIWCV